MTRYQLRSGPLPARRVLIGTLKEKSFGTRRPKAPTDRD